MPVVAVVGMYAGSAVAGAAFAAGTTFFGVAATTIGGVLGAGLASGIYATSQGGSFGQGFMSGAIGAGIGYAMGGIFGDTGAGPTGIDSNAMLTAQEAGFSGSDLAGWGGTASPTGQLAAADYGFGESISQGLDTWNAGNEGLINYNDPGIGEYMPTGSQQIQPDGSMTQPLNNMYQPEGYNPLGENMSMDAYGAQPIDSLNVSANPSQPQLGGLADAAYGGPTTPIETAWQEPSMLSPLEGTGGGALPVSASGTGVTPASSSPSISDMASDAWGRFKTGMKDHFTPKDGTMSMQKMGMGVAGGLYDMYSANKMQDEMKKNLATYQNNMNNPEIGYRNWMQGEGGELLEQQKALAARRGYTNFAPTLATNSLRDWYSQGYKPYMQMQGVAGGAANNIAQMGNYARTRPTSWLGNMYGNKG